MKCAFSIVCFYADARNGDDILSYKVSASDVGRMRQNIPAEDAEVLENVSNLLSTRKQSCPLYRDFGLPLNFVDKPINIAVPLAVAEVTDGLREFEPRAELVKVTFEHDEANPGKLITTIEVDINHELLQKP